jgi:hypothetical protein
MLNNHNKVTVNMKKLSIISNQIKNNTYSYTGKGAFEAVVNNFKYEIIGWLEELVPLQKQIEYLYERSNLEFQKRNYTRILTKLLPKEYTEFVSINILVRDAHIIAQYYHEEFNLTLLHEKLVKSKYLKYPGKYEKYVEFDIFQKFIMMYRDELLTSLDKNNTEEQNPQSKQDKEEQKLTKLTNKNSATSENESTNTPSSKEGSPSTEPKEAETDWMNLLLGKR